MHKNKSKLISCYSASVKIAKNYFKTNHSFTTGQSLIEVLLIVVLVTAVISGSVGFLIQAYSTTQMVSDQTTATYLAMEGIEIVKNIIDANYLKHPTDAWNKGLDIDGSYEVDFESGELGAILSNLDNEQSLKFYAKDNRYGYFKDSKYTSYTIEELTPQNFKRRVEIKNITDSCEGGRTCEISVKSVVNWTGRRCPLTGCEVILEDHFYDWR